jgi:hypothetical protein
VSASDAVQRLREICLALPEATERTSHGEVAFFCGAKGKQFVMLDDHHHGAPWLAFWCAAPPGAQEALIARDPARMFRPPYVGHRGWIGVRIDDVDGSGPDWAEIAEIVCDAYRQVAPRRLAERVPGSA